jgi:hypothetical protein
MRLRENQNTIEARIVMMMIDAPTGYMMSSLFIFFMIDENKDGDKVCN